MISFDAHTWNRNAKVFCGISIFFIVLGLIFGAYRLHFLNSAISTSATITKLIERTNDEGDTLYAPVYVFSDQNDEEVKVISSSASWPPIGDIGDTINILYSPHDPKNSVPNTFMSKWGFSVVFSGLGSFYTILSAIIVYFTGRKIASSEQDAAPNPLTAE